MISMHKCIEDNCLEIADWERFTQFAGTHPFCDKHAKQQKDFNPEDPNTEWYKIKKDR